MKTLSLLACTAALALAACGETCTTRAADVADFSGATCVVKPNVPIDFQVRGACQHCDDTGAACAAELNGPAEVNLNAIYRNCESTSGCPATSCGYPTFDCMLQSALPPGGPYNVVAKTADGTATATVTVDPGSQNTTCTLM